MSGALKGLSDNVEALGVIAGAIVAVGTFYLTKFRPWFRRQPANRQHQMIVGTTIFALILSHAGLAIGGLALGRAANNSNFGKPTVTKGTQSPVLSGAQKCGAPRKTNGIAYVIACAEIQQSKSVRPFADVISLDQYDPKLWQACRVEINLQKRDGSKLVSYSHAQDCLEQIRSKTRASVGFDFEIPVGELPQDAQLVVTLDAKFEPTLDPAQAIDIHTDAASPATLDPRS